MGARRWREAREFVATERSLGRAIVVKIVAPELAAGVSIERFKREIALAARMTHPHIVPLFGAGEARDPHGRAGGLAAIVTDFGIAKALTAARTAPGEPGVARTSTLTQAGTAPGTPACMAPEQAAGDPAADHRADLHALGVVAYEIIAGEPPFGRRAPHELIAALLTEPPQPPSTSRPGVPPALDALVLRLLAKHPDRRPQSANEVLAALDAVGTPGRSALARDRWHWRRLWSRRAWLAVGGAAALGVFAIVGLLRHRRHTAAALSTTGATAPPPNASVVDPSGALASSASAPPVPPARSVAVLPFASLRTDPRIAVLRQKIGLPDIPLTALSAGQQR